MIVRLPTAFCITVFLLVFGIASADSARAVDAGRGITLFDQEQYLMAVRFFTEAVNDESDNPVLHFYLGRSLLALDQSKEALSHLKTAAELQPAEPDYRFWLGVGYWAVMEFEEERQSYLKTLELNPDHIQARLYLGHNYLDRNEWQLALDQYDRVLAIDPGSPEALYNRALALREMGRARDERAAWRVYLERYPTGRRAFRAVEHLNRYGDFSFRPVVLGVRKYVLPTLGFYPFSDTLTPADRSALERLGEALTWQPDLAVHVVAHVDGDHRLASLRAKAVRRYIIRTFPEIAGDRLRLSWFGGAEEITIEDNLFFLDESIRFISIPADTRAGKGGNND